MDLKRVDLRLVVYQSPVGELPCKIRCRQPNHQDSESSMAVYSGGITCFGCGFEVTRRMEALAYLLYGDQARWLDAIKVADQYTRREGGGKPERVTKNTTPPRGSYARLLHGNLRTQRAHRLTWMYERGLSDESIDDFCLGHDGSRFSIPIYDSSNRLLTIRYRRDDWYTMEGWEVPKYCGTPGYNQSTLYPLWKLDGTECKALAIVEGELDVILCWQLGIPAITMTNGAGGMAKIPVMLKEMYPYYRGTLVIIGDMDEPGAKAAMATEQIAREHGYPTERILWHPNDGKDITEYVGRNNKERLHLLWKKTNLLLSYEMRS